MILHRYLRWSSEHPTTLHNLWDNNQVSNSPDPWYVPHTSKVVKQPSKWSPYVKQCWIMINSKTNFGASLPKQMSEVSICFYRSWSRIGYMWLSGIWIKSQTRPEEAGRNITLISARAGSNYTKSLQLQLQLLWNIDFNYNYNYNYTIIMLYSITITITPCSFQLQLQFHFYVNDTFYDGILG